MTGGRHARKHGADRDHPARPATDLTAALAEMQPDFDAETDAMASRAAALYAQKLSRRELADCAVFFAGASGMAYVAAQPALMGQLGRPWTNGGAPRR